MRSNSTNTLIRQLLPLVLRGGPGRWIAAVLLVGVVGWSFVTNGGFPTPDSGGAVTTSAPDVRVPDVRVPDGTQPSAPPRGSDALQASVAGQLTEGPRGVFRSSAGLVYGPGSREGHRLRHVMVHCRDNPGRPGQHGVFSVTEQDEVVALLDEAYERAQEGGRLVRRRDEQERTVWTVDMERPVGYVGGQSGNRRGKPAARHVRLVLEDDRVITAYPVIP